MIINFLIIIQGNMDKEKKTLIHDLYLQLKRDSSELGLSKLKSCATVEYITNLVFPYYLDMTQKKTPINRSEIYNAGRQNDFRSYAIYMLNETDRNTVLNKTYEKIRKEEIASFLKLCIEDNYLTKLKETVISLLNITNIHSNYKLRGKLIELFNRLQIINSINNLDNELICRQFESWIDALYYYFYYAVTDKLHSNIAFSMYPELEEDLDEYNNKVTLMYGSCGNPGMCQLYSMAERKNPNIIALYECGELEYYGKGPSGVVNYQKAYRYYRKTYELNVEHPLATWSIAYMKFHYSLERARIDHRYRVAEFDAELESGSTHMWYDSILDNAQSSYNYGCAAAANLLGKIIDAPDDIFPFERKGRFKYIPSKQLYKESADYGYAYGCNNYAECCLQEAVSSTGKKKVELFKKATKYLNKSLDLGNPWAANKLGYFYLNGLLLDGEEVIIENKDHAYELFNIANTMCRTENYYWPLINLCQNYWLNKENEHFMEKDYYWIEQQVKYAVQHLSDDDQIKELSKINRILIERI